MRGANGVAAHLLENQQPANQYIFGNRRADGSGFQVIGHPLELDVLSAKPESGVRLPLDGSQAESCLTAVDDFAVQTAARCAAKVAGPADDFEATVFTTFKTLAREAAKVLGDQGGDVRAALMDVVRRGRGGDDSVPLWLSDYLFGCDTPELVATVQRAATWLERTRTVLDEPVQLDQLVRERGALLVFYRGGW